MWTSVSRLDDNALVAGSGDVLADMGRPDPGAPPHGAPRGPELEGPRCPAGRRRRSAGHGSFRLKRGVSAGFTCGHLTGLVAALGYRFHINIESEDGSGEHGRVPPCR